MSKVTSWKDPLKKSVKNRFADEKMGEETPDHMKLPLLYGDVKQLLELRDKMIDLYGSDYLSSKTGSPQKRVDAAIQNALGEIIKIEIKKIQGDNFRLSPQDMKRLRTKIFKSFDMDGNPTIHAKQWYG